MTIASFSDYVPLSDLWRIVLVCLVVAVIAPTAAAVAINSYGAREGAVAGRRVALDAGVAFGVLVLLALAGVGIYTLAK
jgi:threonine/homoserine/homoserine lactone efflux protein